MHVDTRYPLKLQRPTPSRPCNKQASPHSSFYSLKATRTITKKLSPSLFSRVQTNQNSHLTLLLFFLRKELEALLSPFSQTHRSNIKRKKNFQLSSPSHTYGSNSNKKVCFNSSHALVPNLKLE